MKSVLSHFLVAYLAVGVVHGWLISLTIPAMNWIGVTTYAIIWPSFFYCAPVERDCNPLEVFPMSIQAWMFTF